MRTDKRPLPIKIQISNQTSVSTDHETRYLESQIH